MSSGEFCTVGFTGGFGNDVATYQLWSDIYLI